MLEHFKNDGVEVIKIDNTNHEIINKGKLTSRPVQEFLDEL
jgi:hypothetical protein